MSSAEQRPGQVRASTERPGGDRALDPKAGRPEGPTELRGTSWKGVLKRTVKEFQEDNATDWAAALTYYGIQSIFPALLVLVSLVGLAGTGTTNALIQNIDQVTPNPARDIIISGIKNLQDSGGAAGLAFVIGILGALWSASGYVGAFTRASNSIWEVEEGRPFYKLRPMQLALTFVLLLLLSVSALAVVATGSIAEQAGKLLGVGDSAVQVWDIAKWPFLLVIVSVMLALLYWAAPNAQQPGIRWVSPGGMFAVVIWLIASALFALYVANFGSYNKTYGSLGGIIAFLVWLWISNIAVLLGAELNAELTRAKQIEKGQPADQEPITPPRDTTKQDKAKEKAAEHEREDERERP
ncbi:MAG: YihY/virulence factor BrkB family protein [Solirubrobacterales bacterium]|nr:YihY/virulence factor BrkB family protein [Solirubrobacterales bacterium]